MEHNGSRGVIMRIMNLYVTHQSALAYWKSPRAARTKVNDWRESLPSLAPGKQALDIPWLIELGIEVNPLHITVGSMGQRVRRDNLVVHLASGPAISGSYEQVSLDVWAASPELCFCQMAGGQSPIKAVKLGYELCAGYRKEPDDMRGFEGREPLTSPKALSMFANRYEGKGAKKARVALQYVHGTAASPMEVAAAMLLTLPRRYGGYGMPACKMNHPIRVPFAGRGGSTTYYADMAWPEHRVVVEYDSDFFHQGSERIHADAARRNALLGAGWQVLTLTKRQLYLLAECETFAAQLTRALRAYNSHATPHATERRYELRRLVLE